MKAKRNEVDWWIAWVVMDVAVRLSESYTIAGRDGGQVSQAHDSLWIACRNSQGRNAIGFLISSSQHGTVAAID
jgi:hypothetical protein